MTPDRHDLARELAEKTGTQLGSEVSPPRRCANGDCLAIIKHDEASPYCSPECQANAEEDASQKQLRALAYERDKGRCFACGADTEAHRAELVQMRGWIEKPTTPEHAHFAKNRLAYYRDKVGYSEEQLKGDRSLWDLHHLVERARGGPNTLANARTACTPCHARLTGKFSKDRAAARKPRGRFGR